MLTNSKLKKKETCRSTENIFQKNILTFVENFFQEPVNVWTVKKFGKTFHRLSIMCSVFSSQIWPLIRDIVYVNGPFGWSQLLRWMQSQMMKFESTIFSFYVLFHVRRGWCRKDSKNLIGGRIKSCLFIGQLLVTSHTTYMKPSIHDFTILYCAASYKISHLDDTHFESLPWTMKCSIFE